MLTNLPIITVILMFPKQLISCVYWGSFLVPISFQSKESLGAQYAIN